MPLGFRCFADSVIGWRRVRSLLRRRIGGVWFVVADFAGEGIGFAAAYVGGVAGD